ncbi:MAG: hypothetical protein MUO26_12115 [Methanotrichaceae archaeon]|nr:hypothetical protein [Methanotrichaceae archaeon]
MNHKKPRFQQEIYQATTISYNVANQVLLEVHHMSTAEPIDAPISEKDTMRGVEHQVEKSDIPPAQKL